MNLIEATLSKLSNIQYYLNNLEPTIYKDPLEILSYSSIGGHTRHVLEFYQCLLKQCADGKINYDLRKRNKSIQEDPEFAGTILAQIMDTLPDCDVRRKLKLEICYDEDHSITDTVDTSLERELVYNLEHLIHHLAIIKIGLFIAAPRMTLPEGFGVAPSTIRFNRNACAQ